MLKGAARSDAATTSRGSVLPRAVSQYSRLRRPVIVTCGEGVDVRFAVDACASTGEK